MILNTGDGAKIAGGNGGAAGYGGFSATAQGGNGGNGGQGGDAIHGDGLTVINLDGASIVGGNGGYGGNGAHSHQGKHGDGGNGGNGGHAIYGSNLTIINSGEISMGLGGSAGKSYASDGGNGQAGTDGAAIYAMGGHNQLTLNSGSHIRGNIILARSTPSQSNTLTIHSNSNSTVQGGLILGNASHLTLSGNQPLTLQGDAQFAAGSSLTLTGDGYRDGWLSAHHIGFNQTKISIQNPITHWTTDSIVLASSATGISGSYFLDTHNNPLLADANNGYTAIWQQGNQLIYGLKWNDNMKNAHGTFNLNKNATLNIGVALTDRDTHAANDSTWNGETLTKRGSGTLILSAANTYTGSTIIDGGTLTTAVDNAFSQTASVQVAPEATLNLGGNSQRLAIGGTLSNRGTILINTPGAIAIKALSVMGDMQNSGNLVLNNCTHCAGQRYTQQGNWRGEHGSVSFGVVLNGDDSLSDQLHITGNASGTTYIHLYNEGGVGAQTNTGIPLITTASSTTGAFKQSGRLLAGSYDYYLRQGNEDGREMQNWYLASAIRPEAGIYAGNLQAANTLFTTRREDRQGVALDNRSRDGATSARRLWMRVVGGHTTGRLSDHQSRYQANRLAYQLGADLLQTRVTGEDSLRLGVMAGYGHQASRNQNRLSGYSAKGTVSGYSTGLYGTWSQHAQSQRGLYLDGWLLYNWFDNHVQGEDVAEETYRSHGLTGSVESGYAILLAEHRRNSNTVVDRVYFTPQAQLQWAGVTAAPHREYTGATVQSLGSHNLQTRLGIRLSMIHDVQWSNTQHTRIEPFIEANWLHTQKRYGAKIDANSTYLAGMRHMAELRLGVTGQATAALSVWGNVSERLGSHHYYDTQGTLGVTYAF
ncbi:autotransporter outer membrane beta-barrel domain-containing protein [Edwardsiella tarda]